jgi:glycosyltransferase involved in cell wall biosynthesis
MQPSTLTSSALKLSICITTFNRAALIGATLDTIVTQITNDCEIVILDGASTDDTEGVIAEYGRRCNRIRYIKQNQNNGLDRDFDRAVELARGEYCWLMCSDDLMRPGAVATVLGTLHCGYSLVVTNMEIRDASLSSLLIPRRLDIDADRIYGPNEMDRLWREALGTVSHISCLIIQRKIWISRNRERYYGSLYVHLAVIMQERLPGDTLVMAEPLICHRYGKQTWRPKAMEMISKWQAVVDSFCIAESTKKNHGAALARFTFKSLLLWRAFGMYSLPEYHRWIRPQLRTTWETMIPAFVALLPGRVVNALLMLCYSMSPYGERGMILQMLKDSPFYVRNWRVSRRATQ